MSSIFKQSPTKQLKQAINQGHCFIELQPSVSFHEAMKSITAIACRLGVKVVQSGYKAVSLDPNDCESLKLLKIIVDNNKTNI